MRQIRETLRLHLQAGLSYNEVGRALKISKSAVGKYVSLARVAGVDWAACPDAERRGAGGAAVPPAAATLEPPARRPTSASCTRSSSARRHPACCCGRSTPRATSAGLQVHQLLRQVPRLGPAGRSARCARPTIAGEKLFVDYAGQTVPIVDAATGEITPGADLRGHAGRVELHLRLRHAAPDHRRLDRRAGHPGAGVHRRRAPPDRARPDPRAHQAPRPLRPQPNRLLRGVRPTLRLRGAGRAPGAPARQAQGRGLGVLVVERWILARLRNRRFFSLAELNSRHRRAAGRPEPPPLQEAARLPAQRLRGHGRVPALRPLPAQRYGHRRWKTAKVNIDYHVEFEGHYYSVPHRLVGQPRWNVRVTGHTAGSSFAGTSAWPAHAVSTRARRFTPRWPSTCRPRTARTCSGRRPSSSPGASASA
jgi:hypothetical protein